MIFDHIKINSMDYKMVEAYYKCESCDKVDWNIE